MREICHMLPEVGLGRGGGGVGGGGGLLVLFLLFASFEWKRPV